jgi:hypothetical protein
MKKLDKEVLVYLKPTTIDSINNLENKNIKEVTFYINRELTVDEILDAQLTTWNIAMHNFIARRLDYLKEENGTEKVYYGHASDGLAYFIADDEIAFSTDEEL